MALVFLTGEAQSCRICARVDVQFRMRNNKFTTDSILSTSRFLVLVGLTFFMTGCGMFGKPKKKTEAELDDDAVSHRIFYEDWYKPNTHGDQDNFFYKTFWGG